MRCYLTFFASFFAFLCFCADAFSILCRRRTGWRFDFGSTNSVRLFSKNENTAYTYFRPSLCVAVVVTVLVCHCLRLPKNFQRNSTALRYCRCFPPSKWASAALPLPRRHLYLISRQRHVISGPGQALLIAHPQKRNACARNHLN